MPCANSTWINTRVNKARIHKAPSSNCNHRLVSVWVWHIQKEIDDQCNKRYISLWQYRCNYAFSLFLMFELRFIILFWDISDLLDRVCQSRCWFVSDKPNLFSTVECFWIDDKMRPRSYKYPAPLAHLLKYYPRPPCTPSFVKSRMLRPLQTNFLLFQQIFFTLRCIYGGNPRVPPQVLASGPKPCGGDYQSFGKSIDL